MDPIRSTIGIARICLPRSGERQVFQGAISMRKEDWEMHQPVCNTVITVYEYSPLTTGSGFDDEVYLRAAVYYVKLGAYAEVSIKGFEDLRQVIFY